MQGIDQVVAMSEIDKIISKHIHVPIERLNDGISYEKESGWDSVNHLKMVAELEKTFKIEFDIDEITELDTVGKIRALVLKKRKQ